jgi:hypothetical protein
MAPRAAPRIPVAKAARTAWGEHLIENAEQGRRADTREPIAVDFIVPVLACGLAAYYLATTTDLVWEARAAGVAVGVPLIIMCVLHMARMLFRIARGRASFSGGDAFTDTLFNRQRLALLVLVALFIAALPWTGTTLGLFLLLIASMWVLDVRSIKQLLGIAITTCAVVYVLLMHLLNSRLPQGPVEWLIAWAFGLRA